MANRFMGADALATEITVPAKQYMWEVVIPDPPGGSVDMWMLRCQSAVLPGRSVGVIHLKFKATAGVRYPGKLQYPHALPLTFAENIDRRTLQGLYNWSNYIVHDERGFGSGDTALKRDCLLNLLNDVDGTVTSQYKIIGAFPERVDDVPVSYDAEADIKYNLLLSYDRWKLL